MERAERERKEHAVMVAIARELLPLMEQVRPAIERHLGRSTSGVTEAGHLVDNPIAVCYGASATVDGIAVGRRLHAGPGMICVDLAWLRDVVREARG